MFTFGDTYWRQLSGTSMGSPRALPWANLLYALCELLFLETFQENLIFYRRFIDNIFGIWITVNPVTNDATWDSLQLSVNNSDFELEWEFEDTCQTISFMDLILSITGERRTTTIFEKANELHLG
jgi:hypothetical protein